MKKNLIYYLLISYGILIFIIAVDFGLGNFFNKQSVNFFRIKHNYYHHGLLPSQASLGIWAGYKYPVYTNNFGFRDTTKTDIQIVESKRQILFIGDSHTEGVGILYENCFPSLIQKERDDIQIFNASAVSYSPKLYYLKVKHILEEEKLHPDEIIVMIDISDIQNEIIYENFRPKWDRMERLEQVIYEFLHRNSFIYFRTKKLISGIKQKKFARESELFEEYIEVSNFDETFSLYADFFDSFDDKLLVSDPAFHNVGSWIYDEKYRKLLYRGLKSGADNIRKLKGLCDKHSIKLKLSVHPWKEQIVKADPSDEYVQFWEEFCKKNDIDFLNLYPAFINPKISIIASGGFFIPNDNHWNETGHRIVAMELGSWKIE